MLSVSVLREALERLRDHGLGELLPEPSTENPFATLAELERYWCERFHGIDAKVRNIAYVALRQANRLQKAEQHLTPEEQSVMHDALRRSAQPRASR